MKSFVWILAHLLAFVTAGCAYRLGSPDRSLPGGYRQLTIPIFRNLTQETGIEVAYTNALIQEFERSRTGKVVDPAQSEVRVEGEIASVQYLPGGKKEGGTLPTGSVLASEYRILVTTRIKLVRVSDRSVLWEGNFSGERTYVAPQVTQAGLNTVNPLYNLSARRQNIEIMATDMMSEAHDRMTENF
jgi:TolB-like protein